MLLFCFIICLCLVPTYENSLIVDTNWQEQIVRGRTSIINENVFICRTFIIDYIIIDKSNRNLMWVRWTKKINSNFPNFQLQIRNQWSKSVITFERRRWVVERTIVVQWDIAIRSHVIHIKFKYQQRRWVISSYRSPRRQHCKMPIVDIK